MTVGLDRLPDEIQFQRPTPVVVQGLGWYGNDALWVSLPAEGILPAVRSADGEALETKFPWWRVHPGRLRIRIAAVGGVAEVLPGEVPSGYGAQGFTPSGLTFTRSGCWRVTGALGPSHLRFTVWVCETTDFDVDEADRQACGAA
jgi:hypothetical protein